MSFPNQSPRVPPFSPILLRGPRYAVLRLLRRGARPLAVATAVGLTVLAAVTLTPSVGSPPTAAAGPSEEPASDPVVPRTSSAAAGETGPAAPGPQSTGRAAAPGSAPTGAAGDDPEQPVRAAVRVWDAAAARLLTPGDVVDVFAVGAETGQAAEERAGPSPAHRLAHRVRVAEVPELMDDSWADPVGGALVVVEVPPSVAAALAGTTADSRLTVTRW